MIPLAPLAAILVLIYPMTSFSLTSSAPMPASSFGLAVGSGLLKMLLS